jgi:hypothetical protein
MAELSATNYSTTFATEYRESGLVLWPKFASARATPSSSHPASALSVSGQISIAEKVCIHFENLNAGGG